MHAAAPDQRVTQHRGCVCTCGLACCSAVANSASGRPHCRASQQKRLRHLRKPTTLCAAALSLAPRCALGTSAIGFSAPCWATCRLLGAGATAAGPGSQGVRRPTAGRTVSLRRLSSHLWALRGLRMLVGSGASGEDPAVRAHPSARMGASVAVGAALIARRRGGRWQDCRRRTHRRGFSACAIHATYLRGGGPREPCLVTWRSCRPSAALASTWSALTIPPLPRWRLVWRSGTLRLAPSGGCRSSPACALFLGSGGAAGPSRAFGTVGFR
jgi:hypothetical protein